MKIIATGGAGFIGSAFVCAAVKAGHDVLTIDKLTYAGNLAALGEVKDSSKHRFIKADINDAALVDAAFRDFKPDAVVHLAAESHVDRSLDEPAAFLTTNVLGTFVLLEAALRHHARIGEYKFRFIHVSTDEVFGTLGETGAFTPESRYAPNSPYAASKAAADHFARAWQQTYGLPVIVTNCANNYGPRQHAEKLIPTVIRHAVSGAPIPVYGRGENMRDWIYVDDHVNGLLLALDKGASGDSYLFGGRCVMRNIDLVRTLCGILDRLEPRADRKRYEEQITFVTDRLGHDFRYAIEPRETESRLNWRCEESLTSGLEKTVRWYLANRTWLTPVYELGRLGTKRQDMAGTRG
jgi:dTDP-glucose 4,6-dehydratase